MDKKRRDHLQHPPPSQLPRQFAFDILSKSSDDFDQF